jgi:hypothetical protein
METQLEFEFDHSIPSYFMLSQTTTSNDVTFSNKDGVVGSLNWRNGAFLFTGNAEASALIFFHHTLCSYNSRVREYQETLRKYSGICDSNGNYSALKLLEKTNTEQSGK